MKKHLIGLFALFVLGIVATGAVSAFGGLGKQVNKEEVIGALEADDFDAWKQAMQAGLNEENFEHMKEMHSNRAQRMEHREEINAALESGDYEAWKQVIESLDKEPIIAEKILDEEDFDTLAELHQARQDKDFDTVKELADELGLEKPHKGFRKARFRQKMSAEN